jgi:intermembrane space import and assembly protein 40
MWIAKAAPAVITEKEKEASSDSSQGAFNEETGEINWDCPVSLS